MRQTHFISTNNTKVVRFHRCKDVIFIATAIKTIGRAGFEAHAAAPHFKAWEAFASTDPFTKEPEVCFYELEPVAQVFDAPEPRSMPGADDSLYVYASDDSAQKLQPEQASRPVLELQAQAPHSLHSPANTPASPYEYSECAGAPQSPPKMTKATSTTTTSYLTPDRSPGRPVLNLNLHAGPPPGVLEKEDGSSSPYEYRDC
jgi:hypothetical protein